MLDASAASAEQLDADVELCRAMIQLVDMATARRKELVAAGVLPEDGCGYDPRLDSVMAPAEFRRFRESSHGRMIFEKGLGSVEAPDADEAIHDSQDPGRSKRSNANGRPQSPCTRRRCRPHGGWAVLLARDARHRMRMLEGQRAAANERAAVVRYAAAQRWLRRQRENNWVEEVDDDDDEILEHDLASGVDRMEMDST